MKRTTQNVNNNLPSTAALVPGPVRPGDRLLVSVGEALWRCGYDVDRAAFMNRLEQEFPDALVMTGKGVRVDLLQLLGTPNPSDAVVSLPRFTVVGQVEFDSLR